jgi:hypothetical protein
VTFRDVAALVTLAAVLRLPALFTDFWFDEILSYERFAMGARSLGDIFFNPAYKHDNNHHLNTIVLYLLRDQGGWVIYRVPAFLAGLAAVAAAAIVGGRRSRVEGILSGLLVAFSFTMVVYSTEGRGYALVMACAVVAFLVLARYLEAPTWPTAAWFWLLVALGLVAHSTIAHFYLGALLWSGYRLRRRWRDFVRLHAPLAVFGAAWVATVTRGGVVGGGDVWTWHQVADESLAWTLGYPTSAVPPGLVLAGLGLLFTVDSRRLWAEGSDEALFYVGTVLGPVAMIWALSPPYLFPRYFVVALVFLLLVLARLLAGLWLDVPRARPVVVGIVLAMALGNVLHVIPFSRYGRGGASKAIAAIATTTDTTPIVVTSPSVDLWSVFPIRFYERKLGLGERIRVISREELAATPQTHPPIDWLIVPTLDHDLVRPAAIHLDGVGSFVLLHRYAAYGPSGMTWIVYRRTAGRNGV